MVDGDVLQAPQAVVDPAVQFQHVQALFYQRYERLEALALQAAFVEPVRRPVGGGDHHHAAREEGFKQAAEDHGIGDVRSEEHTSELQSLMRISYAVFCLKKKNPKLLQITCV